MTGRTGHHVLLTAKEPGQEAGSVTTHPQPQVIHPVQGTWSLSLRSVEPSSALASPSGPSGTSAARTVATEPGPGTGTVIVLLRRQEVLDVRVSVSRIRSATSRNVLREVRLYPQILLDSKHFKSLNL